MKGTQEQTIEDRICERFNSIFYNRRQCTNKLTLEQCLVTSYLCDNIPPELAAAHYGRAVFASFAAKYLPKKNSIIKYLERKDEPQFVDDINREPIIGYCLVNMDLNQAPTQKVPLNPQKIHELEPNNAAMLAGILYSEIFRNKNLLQYAPQARDSDDLKALLFLDYMFRSTANTELDEVMCSTGTIENKAIQVANKIRRNLYGYNLSDTDNRQQPIALNDLAILNQTGLHVRVPYNPAELNQAEFRVQPSTSGDPVVQPPLQHRKRFKRLALALGIVGIALTTALYVGCEKKENPHTTNYAVCE
jgi:hypothetical protein